MIPVWHKRVIESVYTHVDGRVRVPPDFWRDYDPTCLLDILETLSPREAKVIKLRYEDGLSLRAAGAQLGTMHLTRSSVSGERIRQIQAKALRKLRHPSRLRVLTCREPPAVVPQVALSAS